MGWLITAKSNHPGEYTLVADGELEAGWINITDTAGYFDATEVESALAEIGQELLQHNLNGWEDSSLNTLSWDDGTYTLTITPSDTSYYWSDGVRYSITGPESKQLTADQSGVWWFYYDGGTLSCVKNPSHSVIDPIIENKALVCAVCWNTNDDDTVLLADEMHGVIMSGATHHWIHDALGAQFKQGGGISGYTLDVSSDASVTFDLADISYYDDDIEHEITDGDASSQYVQVLTGDAEIPVLYRDDVDGSWTRQAASTLPYVVDVGSIPNRQNDDGDGTWSQVDLGNQKFMLYFLYATNDWEYPVQMVQGSVEYNTKADAQDGANAELVSWGDLPSPEFLLMYVFVIKRFAGGTKNLQIVQVDDYRLQSLSGTSAGIVGSHAALTGLTADDHTQYILHALADAANDFLVADGADSFIKKTLAETGAILEGDIEHDNLQAVPANDHIDHTGVSITAGAGLTGGGDISASRTIDVVGGTGITVNADDIEIDVTDTDWLLDDDTMADNSAVHAVTQQSLVAYVAGELAAAGALPPDPGFDATVLWDDSASTYVSVAPGDGLAITADPTLEIDTSWLFGVVLDLTGGTLTGQLIGTCASFDDWAFDTSMGAAAEIGLSAGRAYFHGYNRSSAVYIDTYLTGLNAVVEAVGGSITLTGAGISGTAIKDEDNMASNSATHLATQQSIKAYVDAASTTESEGMVFTRETAYNVDAGTRSSGWNVYPLTTEQDDSSAIGYISGTLMYMTSGWYSVTWNVMWYNSWGPIPFSTGLYNVSLGSWVEFGLWHQKYDYGGYSCNDIVSHTVVHHSAVNGYAYRLYYYCTTALATTGLGYNANKTYSGAGNAIWAWVNWTRLNTS